MFYKSDINKNKDCQHVLFDFLLIKQDIKKWWKSKISSFVRRTWKLKKEQNKLDLPEREFEPQMLVNFPSMIWIFMESEGDQIKTKQASKKDWTLIVWQSGFFPHHDSDQNSNLNFYLNSRRISLPFASPKGIFASSRSNIESSLYCKFLQYFF